MTNAERISALYAEVGQAHQVIGAYFAGPDGKHPDFDSPDGQRALDYFVHERYDDDFLASEHPRKWQSTI
ncbi:hypothetical protein [Rhizobium sp. Leaf453]|uniref:hypothetical protein n=1 Tax=Rhizobium sp. Leaf453 TaxID=1736380 RepID=UPI000712B847|nr:hypothetical protein [Rhizobium sp. Leaf453]KQU05886.1 hypothetical protein ASG68_24250 [Rhizobium sp. Leaf453]